MLIDGRENATVGGDLNFRFRMVLKGTVRSTADKETLLRKQMHCCGNLVSLMFLCLCGLETFAAGALFAFKQEKKCLNFLKTFCCRNKSRLRAQTGKLQLRKHFTQCFYNNISLFAEASSISYKMFFFFFRFWGKFKHFLKWYYDQRVTFLCSLSFENISSYCLPCQISNLIILTAIFVIGLPPLLNSKNGRDTILRLGSRGSDVKYSTHAYFRKQEGDSVCGFHACVRVPTHKPPSYRPIHLSG